MKHNVKMSPEVAKQLCEGVCKKCVYKDQVKSIHQCCYQHSLSEDLTQCSNFHKSPYWKKKDRDSELAIDRAKMVEKGIAPKFVLGQEVWESCWYSNTPTRTTVREMYPDPEYKYWIYKVVGHTEQYFVDTPQEHSLASPIFATEQECMRYIIENFMESTLHQAERLAEYARKIGMEIGPCEVKFLESPKKTDNNN